MKRYPEVIAMQKDQGGAHAIQQENFGLDNDGGVYLMSVPTEKCRPNRHRIRKLESWGNRPQLKPEGLDSKRQQ